MQKKKHDAKVGEPDDQVKLKPFMGMRPGVYLAIGLSAAILIALFFLLLFPGIANPGSVVIFTSEPSGAALRVDGVYAGSAPCKAFVSKGSRVMETALPGFESDKAECFIPGRLFASLLFPRRYRLNVMLETADAAGAFAASALDYASWTFAGEPTSAWQIPLSLSEGMYRLGSGAYAVDSDGMLAASARFAVTRAAMRDIIRAQSFSASGGLSPSPLNLLQAVSDVAAFLDANPDSAAWLADALPDDAAAIVIASDWYLNQLSNFASITAQESLAPPPGDNAGNDFPSGQIRVGGILFAGIGGGSLVQGEPFPHHVPVEPFMISVTEIPAPAYADFLDANPQWRLDQLEALAGNGLVNSEYLADFGSITLSGNRAISGVGAVSWFAAQAFCEWLGGMLPASFSGWEIRLPTEAEWEFAHKTSSRWGGGIFTQDIVWEWCSDPFSPLPFLSAPRQAVDAIGSPERSVRGGSGLNFTGHVKPETRASLPPDSCSPFVSFRPVIARVSPGNR